MEEQESHLNLGIWPNRAMNVKNDIPRITAVICARTPISHAVTYLDTGPGTSRSLGLKGVGREVCGSTAKTAGNEPERVAVCRENSLAL